MSEGIKDQGGCLCGSVRYEVNRDSVFSAHNCHCLDCQKSTGSGYTTFFLLPAADFLLLSGELKSYQVEGSSGGEVERSFCPECGSPIVSSARMAEGIVMVKAGSLDNSDWLTLVSSFWGGTARPWARPDEALPVSETNP